MPPLKKALLAGIWELLFMVFIGLILAIILKPDYLVCFMLLFSILCTPAVVGYIFFSYGYWRERDSHFSAYEKPVRQKSERYEFHYRLRIAAYFAVPILLFAFLIAFFSCGLKF